MRRLVYSLCWSEFEADVKRASSVEICFSRRELSQAQRSFVGTAGIIKCACAGTRLQIRASQNLRSNWAAIQSQRLMSDTARSILRSL